MGIPTSPSCSARSPRRTILFSFLRPQHQRATLASATLLPSVCCRVPCVLAACICVRARAPRIFLHLHPPFRVHSPCFLHPDGARSLPPVPSRVPGGPCRKLCCVLPWACHCHLAPLFQGLSFSFRPVYCVVGGRLSTHRVREKDAASSHVGVCVPLCCIRLSALLPFARGGSVGKG